MNRPDRTQSPFRILTVCSANVCRSPLIAALLQAAVGDDEDVEVASAGTSALTGHRVHPAVAAHLEAIELALPRALPRQVTVSMVDGADLVLTAERAHRSWIARLRPNAVRRTFTLLEFADLARLATAEAATGQPPRMPAMRLAWLLDQAPRYRSARVSRVDDIADPVGRGPDAFDVAVEQITSAVAAVLPVAPGASATPSDSRATPLEGASGRRPRPGSADVARPGEPRGPHGTTLPEVDKIAGESVA